VEYLRWDGIRRKGAAFYILLFVAATSLKLFRERLFVTFSSKTNPRSTFCLFFDLLDPAGSSYPFGSTC
jgi:hypothetical protein